MYLLSLIKHAKFHNIRTAFDFFINYLVYLKMSRKETGEAFGGRDIRKLSGDLTRFHPSTLEQQLTTLTNQIETLKTTHASAGLQRARTNNCGALLSHKSKFVRRKRKQCNCACDICAPRNCTRTK